MLYWAAKCRHKQEAGALTSLVPNQMSLMWSQMALAADMALESFLALIMAAPRCCTVCKENEEELTGRRHGEKAAEWP